MRDGPVRAIIKRFALWRYVIDLKLTRWWLSRQGDGAHYELRGFCNGCGKCCIRPTIQTWSLVFRLKSLKWLLLSWHRWINGFICVDEDKATHTFSFRCTHYDLETKQCDSYWTRPGMCRDYPTNLIHGVNPEFFEECDYYAVAKNAASFRESLSKTDLSEEQREALLKKLHIKE